MPEVPSAVSFKELTNLLKAAGSTAPAEDGSDGGSVSLDWAERVTALLKEVEQSSAAASDGKTVDQVMALGSFRTHLLPGLQAIKAEDI